MNSDQLREIIDNPATSPRDRLAAIEKLQRLGDATPAPLEPLGENLSLKKLLPHRFPDNPQRAYYRGRAFLPEIELGGLAKRLLEDSGWRTMADPEECAIDFREKFAKHRDHDKLKALWRAGQAVLHWEYQIDFAADDSLPLFMIIYRDRTPEEIADLFFDSLAQAKAEYRSLAAEFPPDKPKAEQSSSRTAENGKPGR